MCGRMRRPANLLDVQIPQSCRHSLATEGVSGQYFTEYFDFCSVTYSAAQNGAAGRFQVASLLMLCA